MKKVIVISGTPGVGKSALARSLKGFTRLDLHEHYKDISTQYNRSKQCYDVDMKKFEKLVKEKLKESDLVIDSHIAHLLPKKLVDLCVILTCSNLKKLEKRLVSRKYSKKKIRENLDSEIFQECLMGAKKKDHKVLVFDVSKVSKEEMLKKIRKIL